MDVNHFLVALGLSTCCSIVIKYASDTFAGASNYLGRNLAAGVKGATINAACSSMPELVTTAAFLFLYQDLDGFSAGVATAAGSAVFNGLIIPALCILVVCIWGVREGGTTRKVRHIELDSRTILRDGCWLVIGEVVLIVFLGDATLTWVAGAALLLCYVGYFVHLMYHNRKFGLEVPGAEEYERSGTSSRPRWKALLTLDFNALFFGGRPFSTARAWVTLAAATVVLGAACALLAEAVVEAASALGITTYFTAVVLAAAATSVPDTVLSVKDARNGAYDDAVSNALGSNIFNVAVALGLPLLVYTLVYGEVSLTAVTGASHAEVRILQIVLLCVTVIIVGLFLLGRKAGLGKAALLLLIYAGWMTWIADSAFHLGIFPRG